MPGFHSRRKLEQILAVVELGKHEKIERNTNSFLNFHTIALDFTHSFFCLHPTKNIFVRIFLLFLLVSFHLLGSYKPPFKTRKKVFS